MIFQNEQQNRIQAYNKSKEESQQKREATKKKKEEQLQAIQEQAEEQIKDFAKDIHTIYLPTKSSYFTVQIEVPTLAKTVQFALQSWEAKTIANANASLGLIQLITKLPVEFHYGIFPPTQTLQLALTVKGTVKMYGEVVSNYMKNVIKNIPHQDLNKIKILVAAGDTSIDFDEENEWVQDNIIKPTYKQHYQFGKRKQENPIEQLHQEPQPNNFSLVNLTGISRAYNKELIIAIYTALLNIANFQDQFDNRAHPKLSWQYSNLISLVAPKGQTDSQNGIIDQEALLFVKNYLVGTKAQQSKKIGLGLQFLVSSGAFPHEYLKHLQSILESSYSAKIKS